MLEVEKGFWQRTISDLGHRASIQAQRYMDLIGKTRQTLWKTISLTQPQLFQKAIKDMKIIRS
jgi:hypothetical protein